MANRSAGAPLRPLNPGNIVSSGVQLYRNGFSRYIPQALIAYLWILVPVYGWAKFYMLSAVLSRVAFQELIDQPETIPQARAKLRSSLWSFWGIAFRMGCALFGVYILGVIAIAIAAVVTFMINPILGGIVTAILFIGFLVLMIRLFSRWFVAELPLAVENGVTGLQSFNRSWKLTEKSVGRIQLVAFIGFLVTLPLTALTGYLPNILFTIFAPEFAVSPVASVIVIAISLAGGILVMPFWQVLKAVVYYDLRSRQEGFDLELRDRL